MIYTEKFKNSNKDILEKLIGENLEAFNMNFLDVYEKSSKINKYALRNSMLFFKSRDSYVGYVWFFKDFGQHIKIIDIYIKLNYLQYLDLDKVDKLKNKNLFFEGINNYLNATIMNMNNFVRVRSIKLLELNLKNKNFYTSDDLSTEITFKTFISGRDECVRCDLQNDIFYNRERLPLKPSDIFYEEEQDYYREDFSQFMYYKKAPIGYGQIIYKNNHFLIVNFGIREEVRKNGYGERFIKYLCNLAKDSDIDKVYIQVKRDNFKALNLYKKIGFVDRGNIVSWVRD